MFSRSMSVYTGIERVFTESFKLSASGRFKKSIEVMNWPAVIMHYYKGVDFSAPFTEK